MTARFLTTATTGAPLNDADATSASTPAAATTTAKSTTSAIAVDTKAAAPPAALATSRTEYSILQNRNIAIRTYSNATLLTLLQENSSGTIRLIIFYISYAMFLLQFALSFVVDHRKKPRSNRPPDEQTFLLSEKSDDVVDAVSKLLIVTVI